MTKKFFTVAFCLCLAVGAFAQTYSGGNGEASNPYLISNKADMEALATAVNGGNSYSGKHFLLTEDLTGITTIIGNADNRPFSGTFDGGGHVLTVNINTTGQYAGVFGYAEEVTIKNLGVGGSVKTTNSSAIWGSAGGICGEIMDGFVTGCYNTASISATTTSSGIDSYSGGICGSSSYSSAISGCYNTGDISSSSSYSSSSSSSSSSSYSGGICGASYSSSISNCYNAGEISSTSSYSSSGGICGYSYSSPINKCYNTGEISSSAYSSKPDYNPRAYSGGICGSSYSSPISNCYNMGDIFSSSYSSSPSSFMFSYSGGICGSSSSPISNCYNTGDISSSDISGGICGSSSSPISNCYSTGDISSSDYSGGICGYSYSSISNCYNTGDISSSYVSSGICGYGGNIKNCFVAGCRIAGRSGMVSRIGIGVITNCYADKNITLNGATISDIDADSMDGKDATFAIFQSQSWIQSNLQWDFQTMWEMSNVNDPAHKGLPILKGMDNAVDIPFVKPKESISVDVFPNPVKDELFVKSDHPIKKIEICTLSGTRIAVKETIGQGINLSVLPNGTYLVRMYTEKGVVTRKIIKN